MDFQGTVLQTADDAWNLDKEFRRYVVIGSNGSGDPICLDVGAESAVVYLNHDNNFERVWINSSVHQLAGSLLRYRQLVQETQRRNGEDAFLDGKIPGDVIEKLRADLQRIDATALAQESFWRSELDCLETGDAI